MATRQEILDILIRAKDSASRDLEKVGVEAESVGARVGKAAHMIGIGMAAAGVAAAGAIVVSVKAAADYQELVTALHTGAGETAANLDLVSRGMLDMAGKVGVSAQDLARGMYMIESAGYHGAAGLEVLRASAEGAKVGMADQSVVADALTTVLKDYHLSASDAAGVTGQMIAAVAAGKMHMSDFAASISTMLPVAAGLHIPFQQIAAAMATMTAHGVQANVAATGMRYALTQLISPSATASKAMADLGVPMGQLQTLLASGNLTGALELFRAAMDRASASGKSNAQIMADVTKAFGGVRGGTIATTLLPNLDEYARNVASVGTVSQGAAKLASGWADVQKDLNTQLAMAGASLSSLAIEIGQALLPPLTQAVRALTAFLQPVMAWVSEHPRVAAAFLVVTAALGALSMAAMALGPALSLLVPLLGAIGAPLLVIAAASGLLYEAWTHDWGGIREIVASVWNALRPVFNAFGGAIDTLRQGLSQGGLAGALAALPSAIMPLAAAFGFSKGQVQAFGEGARAAFGTIGTALSQLWAYVSPTLRQWGQQAIELGQQISTRLGPAFQQLSTIVRAVVGGIVIFWTGAWDGITQVLAAAIEMLKATVQGGMQVIGNTIKLFLDLFTGNWRGAWQDIQGILSGIGTIGKAVLQGSLDILRGVIEAWVGGVDALVKNVGPNVQKAITDAFASAGGWLVDAGGQIIGGLMSGITGRLGDLKSTLGGIGHDITSWKGPPSKDAVLLVDNGRLIMQSLINGMNSKQSDVRAFLGGVSQAVQTAIASTQAVAATPAQIQRDLSRAQYFEQRATIDHGARARNDIKRAQEYLARAGVTNAPGMALAAADKAAGIVRDASAYGFSPSATGSTSAIAPAAAGVGVSSGSGGMTVNITIAKGAISVDGAGASASQERAFAGHIKAAIEAVVRSQLLSQPGTRLGVPGVR